MEHIAARNFREAEILHHGLDLVPRAWPALVGDYLVDTKVVHVNQVLEQLVELMHPVHAVLFDGVNLDEDDPNARERLGGKARNIQKGRPLAALAIHLQDVDDLPR